MKMAGFQEWNMNMKNTKKTKMRIILKRIRKTKTILEILGKGILR